MADRRGSVLIALWSLAVLTLVGCAEDDPVSTEVLRAELICDSTITVTEDSRSEDGYRWVLDAVALPASNIRHDLGRIDAETGLQFSKMGLLVRPGTQSTIAVIPGQEAEIRLAWGYADGPAPAQEFVVPACDGEEDFLIYSGGLWVSEPACVALTVSARDLTEEIVIPVATDCP